MAESFSPSKSPRAKGGKHTGAIRKARGAEGGTSPEAKGQVSDAMREYLLSKENVRFMEENELASKENVPPPGAPAKTSKDPGRSSLGEMNVLKERDSSFENMASPEKEKPEEKYFKLKPITEKITARFVPISSRSQSDDEMDYHSNRPTETFISYSITIPERKKDPRNNLGNFHPMAIATTVPDLWAFDTLILRSGAFVIEGTDKIKSYKCHERYMIPEDDESDLDMTEDLDSADDFLSLASGVNYLGGAVCKGHFKVQKITKQIFRVKTSKDSLCKRCSALVPVPGMIRSHAVKFLKNHLEITPFVEEINDQQSSYKFGWIEGGCAKQIVSDHHEILAVTMFDDCVTVSVEVASRIMRRDAMFFPFAFLIGNNLEKEDITSFLKYVVRDCDVKNCSYVLVTTNYDVMHSVCSACFPENVKIIPDFYMVLEPLRESWLGQKRDIGDFENSSAFYEYVDKVRVSLGKKMYQSAFPSIERTLECSIGIDYYEISNIEQIKKSAESYLRHFIIADVCESDFDKVSSKIDYFMSLEFICKQPFETKVRYLHNCSTFRCNHVTLMMPEFVNP